MAGIALRLYPATHLSASGDLENFRYAARAVRESGLHVYGSLGTHYPYPPGYLPWLMAANSFGDDSFAAIARLLPIAADALIAWFVQDELRAGGADGLKRILAVALVIPLSRGLTRSGRMYAVLAGGLIVLAFLGLGALLARAPGDLARNTLLQKTFGAGPLVLLAPD